MAPGQALSSQCKAWVSWGGAGRGGAEEGGGEKPIQQKWWPNLDKAAWEGRCDGLGKGVGWGSGGQGEHGRGGAGGVQPMVTFLGHPLFDLKEVLAAEVGRS